MEIKAKMTAAKTIIIHWVGTSACKALVAE